MGQVGQQERLPVSASQKVLYIKTDSHIAIEESGISSVCLFLLSFLSSLPVDKRKENKRRAEIYITYYQVFISDVL